MYAFARQPKWIVAHLLVLVLLACFLVAASWQWSRHQARSDQNDAVRARTDLAPLGLDDLVQLDPPAQEFRLIELDGTWRPADLVTIRNRSQDGASGCHVAAPLSAGAGIGVLVTVGWLPEQECQPPRLEANLDWPEASAVTGRLRRTQTRGALGPRDPAEGILDSLARTDVARVDQQVDLTLAPMYIELIAAEPPVDGPVVLDAPSTDAGPHLAYTGQWLLFALVAAIGYPLVLLRQARRGDLEDLGPPED